MALIRRCIIRDLQYVLKQELPRIVKAQEPDDHFHWINRMMQPFRAS
ncbi:hypothetical protein HYPGJ_20113 [Hyphomicrobium sp. GJ21]|nr:hypothetical protein HYPGJ_20113 [Hyphomicrobium sp. GJ21]